MHIEYLCFHADRISFEPSKDQVIFFTPRNRHYRMGLSLIKYVDDNYELIINQFQRKGLEFVFLPRATRELNIPELYKYFRPDANEKDIESYQKGFFPEELLDYLIEGCPDIYNMPFGLLRYTGFRNEKGYIFNYTPVFCEEQWFVRSSKDQLNLNMFNQLDYYLRYNAGSSYVDYFDYASSNKTICCSKASISNDSLSGSDELFSCDEWDGPCFLQKKDIDICVADENFSSEVIGLLSEFQRIAVELRKRGIWELVINKMFQPTQMLSRIVIHNNRIFLPDYNNLEIKMPSMAKAVYFLFLRHPEGIKFKHLPDYRNELRTIYASISRFDDKERIEKSIMDVTDPMKNTINENTSRIKKAFAEQFDENLAKNYYITGVKGEAKKITLPQELITWDQRLLK
jgi:hypothetical protein